MRLIYILLLLFVISTANAADIYVEDFIQGANIQEALQAAIDMAEPGSIVHFGKNCNQATKTCSPKVYNVTILTGSHGVNYQGHGSTLRLRTRPLNIPWQNWRWQKILKISRAPNTVVNTTSPTVIQNFKLDGNRTGQRIRSNPNDYDGRLSAPHGQACNSNSDCNFQDTYFSCFPDAPAADRRCALRCPQGRRIECPFIETDDSGRDMTQCHSDRSILNLVNPPANAVACVREPKQANLFLDAAYLPESQFQPVQIINIESINSTWGGISVRNQVRVEMDTISTSGTLHAIQVTGATQRLHIKNWESKNDDQGIHIEPEGIRSIGTADIKIEDSTIVDSNALAISMTTNRPATEHGRFIINNVKVYATPEGLARGVWQKSLFYTFGINIQITNSLFSPTLNPSELNSQPIPARTENAENYPLSFSHLCGRVQIEDTTIVGYVPVGGLSKTTTRDHQGVRQIVSGCTKRKLASIIFQDVSFRGEGFKTGDPARYGGPYAVRASGRNSSEEAIRRIYFYETDFAGDYNGVISAYGGFIVVDTATYQQFPRGSDKLVAINWGEFFGVPVKAIVGWERHPRGIFTRMLARSNTPVSAQNTMQNIKYCGYGSERGCDFTSRRFRSVSD